MTMMMMGVVHSEVTGVKISMPNTSYYSFFSNTVNTQKTIANVNDFINNRKSCHQALTWAPPRLIHSSGAQN